MTIDRSEVSRALAKARELWPNEEILCDEPASEGFYGE
jgi:hypothetical protein